MDKTINYERIHKLSQDVVNDLEGDEEFCEKLNAVLGIIANEVGNKEGLEREDPLRRVIQEHARESVWQAIEGRNQHTLEISQMDRIVAEVNDTPDEAELQAGTQKAKQQGFGFGR